MQCAQRAGVKNQIPWPWLIPSNCVHVIVKVLRCALSFGKSLSVVSRAFNTAPGSMDLQISLFLSLFPSRLPFCVLSSQRRFQPDAACQANVCAQEPDMRLRHRFHHQRHAHRGQPGAAERHEIGACGVFQPFSTTQKAS